MTTRHLVIAKEYTTTLNTNQLCGYRPNKHLVHSFVCIKNLNMSISWKILSNSGFLV